MEGRKSEGDINIKAHDDDPPPIMRPHTARGARQTNSLVVRSAHPTSSKYEVDAEKFPKLAKNIAMWEDKKFRSVDNSEMHGSVMTPIDRGGHESSEQSWVIVFAAVGAC